MVAFIVNLVCITIIEVIIEELGTRWEMEKKSGKRSLDDQKNINIIEIAGPKVTGFHSS